MSANESALDKKAMEIQWSEDTCDKYDYMIAASCGALAGLVDIFFVGSAVKSVADLSRLGKLSDAMADSIVKKISRALGWNPAPGKESNMSSAIAFLEQKYKVPYEHTSTKSVNGMFQMSTKNHHFKSLGHAPDAIGLFFSILDQFSNSASFFSDGKLIRVDASDRGFELQGGDFLSKVFSGFCNWLGHLMSDFAGSNGSRAVGNLGRGTGLPVPFMELFLLCDFGKFQIGKDRQTLAVLMTRAFQEGYDMRHAGAMAVPVLLEELMIKVIWMIKRHFYHKKKWQECFPTASHADLRMMLLLGNGTLCLMDGMDAAIRSGGNALSFVLHMNLLAWARFLMLVFRELKIRYGAKVDAAAEKFLANLGFHDRKSLELYYERMNVLDQKLDQALRDVVAGVERDYRKFVEGLNQSLNPAVGTPETRRMASINFAREQGVAEDRIIETTKEMRYWLGQGWK